MYPHPCWDNSNYSYLSLTRRGGGGGGGGGGGEMLADTPQFTESLLQWSACRMNNEKM